MTKEDCLEIEHPIFNVVLRVPYSFILPALVSDLDTFFIEVAFIGIWTDAREAVFQSAADR